ncbi:MAG: MBOAT family protein [Lachnospiraceae bacterium]|nr:MBOAT family protein [Lachnospiraceae bacterium]
MSFTSYEFIAFMLLVMILYYVLPKKCQWPLLLVASYIFYAAASPYYLIFIAATTVSTYLVSLPLSSLHKTQKLYLKENKANMSKEEKKAYKASIKKKQWRWLLLCLFFNFGILGVLKYTNFAIANVNGIFNTSFAFQNIILPMGISFYTFQTMGYIIDVYRGQVEAEKNPFKLALFVSFFPQLVQGPISRFSQLAPTLFAEKKYDHKTVSFGLQRILWGYFKKVIIADRLLVAVQEIISQPNEYTGIFVVVGMVFYAAELYADFTGGIDITIGIAEVMGIKMPENFERPYFSKNIAEYWRRWHITMGTWFKDYIFYPISVCQPMLKFSTKCRKVFGDNIGKRIPVYVSTIFVWFVTGVWHGASWNFIMWGTFNGIIIMISQELEPVYAWFHSKFNVDKKLWFNVFRIVRTFFLMCSLRIFDCYRDVLTAFKMFGSIFTDWNLPELFNGSLMNLGLTMGDYVVLIVAITILFIASLLGRHELVREKLARKNIAVRYLAYVAIIVAILVFGAYGPDFDPAAFIYGQF